MPVVAPLVYIGSCGLSSPSHWRMRGCSRGMGNQVFWVSQLAHTPHESEHTGGSQEASATQRMVQDHSSCSELSRGTPANGVASYNFLLLEVRVLF